MTRRTRSWATDPEVDEILDEISWGERSKLINKALLAYFAEHKASDEKAELHEEQPEVQVTSPMEPPEDPLATSRLRQILRGLRAEDTNRQETEANHVAHAKY